MRIKTKKIRGIKKDENNAFIRLVDAVCGLIRDAEAENKWALEILNELMKNGIVKSL
ncbi:MAG: hypothetical protein V3574_04760 [Candidatus Moraniibacteriota bacterium]